MYEYTPILKSILTSTIWSEPPYVRVVWLAMLLSADRHGRIGAAVPGIARISAVPVEEARDAIARLEAPDADSRSKEFSGRRIEPIEGGWQILNYAKHREMLNKSGVLSNKRVERFRERKRNAETLHVYAGNDQDQDQDQDQKKRDQNLPSSVPERSAPVPVDKPVKKRESKPKPTTEPARMGYRELVDHYFAVFEARRRAKPCFGAREGKAINQLLDASQDNLDRARAILTNAYLDPWWGDKSTILTISADPSKFASQPTGQSKPERWGPGGGNGPQPNDPNNRYKIPTLEDRLERESKTR